MRKLMWFAIGFTVACAAGVYLFSGTWLGLTGLCLLIAAGLVWLLDKKRRRILAAVLLGCAIGFAWMWGYDSIYLSHARDADGQTLSLSVTAADYSYETQYGVAFDGRTQLEGKTYQLRCYLNTKEEVKPGDSITGEFLLRYTADGGKQEPTYHQGKGIFLLAYEKGEAAISKDQAVKWMDYPAIWRGKLLSLLENIFPKDTAGFAKALLLGDSTDLSYAQDRNLQLSGIRHVVAVSGLHVSILFSILLGISGYRRVLPSLLGIPVLILFAAMAGFTPSVVRACTMYSLMLLALMADREYDPPSALGFAVLVILAVNPLAITSVSFQLSVACTVGILLFENRLRAYLYSFGNFKEQKKGKSFRARLLRWCVGTVSVTLSSMVLTVPLCAVYFGLVSIIGILTNLLALWVVSYIFYGIMITCVLGLVWLPLGKLFAWVIGWLIRYVLGISSLFASFPLAAVYTDSIYIVLWIIFSYVLLLAFFLWKRKHPGIVAGGIAALLCVCVALSWIEPRLDDTRVSVIDVGQGQSILLQNKGSYYLVDCGSERSEEAADHTANFLLSQGIFRLDGIILTHYDTDHAGAVTDLLSSVKVETIYMLDATDENGNRSLIEAKAVAASIVREQTQLQIPTGTITLYPAHNASNDNESSMCVLFQPENCDILITGDRSSAGERELLEHAKLPRLSLLVAGHHGAKSATCRELLYATSPEYVAISAGENNRYGHPHPQTLSRLEEYGCKVLRTDVQGTIIFRR